MSIAKSNRQDVLEKIRDVIRGMTDAGVYNFPVRADAQVTTDPTVNVLTAPATGLPLYTVEPQTTGAKEYQPGMHLVEVMLVNVMGRVDTTSVNPDERMQIWEGMAADLERAFAADVTLAGIVYDVRLLVVQPFVGIGSHVVAIVQPIEVRMHRAYGAP